MGIFGKIKERLNGGNEAANNNADRWNMDGVQFRGSRAENAERPAETNAQRQQRKIIVALARSGDGPIDMSAIGDNSVVVSDEMRQRILEKMAHGGYIEQQEHDLIANIDGPIDRHGAESVFRDVSGDTTRRILSEMSGRGFGNWQYTAANDVNAFIEKYPNPDNFLQAESAFMSVIRQRNSDEIVQQYEEGMEAFKKAVYGKKYEYFQQIQVLNAEAQEMARRERRTQKMGHNTARIAEMMRRTESPDTPRVRRAARYEAERNMEWKPGEAKAFRISRRQTMTETVSRENIDRGLYVDDTCQDSLYMNEGDQLFGVFDGAGGHSGGQIASRLACSSIGELSRGRNVQAGKDLAEILNRANDRIVNSSEAGLTTAVLAKVVERNGRKILAYASAGDSRIYVVGSNGVAHQITKDEGMGKFIFNSLGDKNDEPNPVKQFGEIALTPGDRVVLCSDGITGDYGDDLMSDAEMASIVRGARTPDDAAKNLVALARKKDDRTALVFGA